ncbi:MAG: hypothetical protein JJU16_01480 [Alkalibacterium sp.]|nr:hypothetical protein [Alkalibacterium sp.]
MLNNKKRLTYLFGLGIVIMNSVLMMLELDRLFRIESNRALFGTHSPISQSEAMEMQQIIQTRELIWTGVTVISIALFLVAVYTFKSYLPHFFFILSGINLLFSLGVFIISFIWPFHIFELIAPLTLPLLMNVFIGWRLLIIFLKTRNQNTLQA